MSTVRPADIKTNSFMNSVFQNTECEVILHNIVLMQKKLNPENWTPFSWQQYKDFCTHSVSNDEQDVLEAFVRGGKPTWNTSAYLQPGWLSFDKETNKYFFTDKMINMLSDRYHV